MNNISRASILITDDESNIRMMLRTALESEGYYILEASNGRDALTAIAQSPPDLVLLDLNMPELDGISMMEQLKSLSAKAPRVIILTAHGSIPAAVKAMRLGARDFVQKPVTPIELRQTVRSVLNEPELDPIDTVGLELRDSYEHVLDRIRRSLRMADITSAETLLTKAADRRGQHSAEYFNLLGVLYETQHNWRLSRKCYGKAIAADKRYEAAQINMRRLFELYTFGRSAQPVLLGDEETDAMIVGSAHARP